MRESIVKNESTNLQWLKLSLNWGMVLILTACLLLRGSGETSIIGVKRCDPLDWILFAGLQAACFIMTTLGILLAKREYMCKVYCKYEFTPGDFQASP